MLLIIFRLTTLKKQIWKKKKKTFARHELYACQHWVFEFGIPITFPIWFSMIINMKTADLWQYVILWILCTRNSNELDWLCGRGRWAYATETFSIRFSLQDVFANLWSFRACHEQRACWIECYTHSGGTLTLGFFFKFFCVGVGNIRYKNCTDEIGEILCWLIWSWNTKSKKTQHRVCHSLARTARVSCGQPHNDSTPVRVRLDLFLNESIKCEDPIKFYANAKCTI